VGRWARGCSRAGTLILRALALAFLAAGLALLVLDPADLWLPATIALAIGVLAGLASRLRG